VLDTHGPLDDGEWEPLVSDRHLRGPVSGDHLVIIEEAQRQVMVL